jgi:hypothetical protein
MDKPAILSCILLIGLVGSGETAKGTLLRDLLISEGFTEARVEHPLLGDTVLAPLNAAFVRVEINGHPLRLQIDTGSVDTVLADRSRGKSDYPTGNQWEDGTGLGGLPMPTRSW